MFFEVHCPGRSLKKQNKNHRAFEYYTMTTNRIETEKWFIEMDGGPREKLIGFGDS